VLKIISPVMFKWRRSTIRPMVVWLLSQRWVLQYMVNWPLNLVEQGVIRHSRDSGAIPAFTCSSRRRRRLSVTDGFCALPDAPEIRPPRNPGRTRSPARGAHGRAAPGTARVGGGSVRMDARDNYRILLAFLGRLKGGVAWNPATWGFSRGRVAVPPLLHRPARADHIRRAHSRGLRHALERAQETLRPREKASTDDGR